MTLHQRKLTAHQGLQHSSFEIVPQLPEMALVYEDGNEFAQLNEKAARAFDEICQTIPLRLEAFVNVSNCLKVLQRAKRPGDALIDIDVNVYATIDTFEDAGHQLSARKLYLQHTDYHCNDVEYRNPHMLSLPGYQSSNVVSRPFIQEAKRALDSHFEEILSDVYSSLGRGETLHGLKADAQVKSILYE
jgi:hypothetical protein